MAMNTPRNAPHPSGLSGPPGPPGSSGPSGPDGRPEPADAAVLACGRDLAALWEETVPGTDAHSPSCAPCREALADLQRLRTAALAATPSPARPPDAEALVRRVMDVVRLELRPGRSLPLGEPDEDTWVYESVAARTLRAAAEEVPGVRAGSCRIAPPVSGGAGRGAVTVELEVTAAYGPDLRAVSDAVRARALRAARERLGLAVAALHVTVTDLHDLHDLREAGP